MATMLMILKPQFKQAAPAEFYTGQQEPPDLSGYADEFPRGLDIDPVIGIVNEAMRKFSAQLSRSDAWLAPRIHATLRISRREAGDRRLWEFLAAGPLYDYVHWRWRGEGEASDKFRLRFFGSMREHAVARLWWGAELTRNGGSYECTKLLFQNTDVPNSWLNLRALRHRPAAIAAVRFIYNHEIDGVAVGDRHRDLVKSFNAALTTTVLDAVAPNPPGDPAALEEWLGNPIDETLYYNDDPPGPNEVEVPEKNIDAVESLLARIAAQTNFERRSRTTKGAA